MFIDFDKIEQEAVPHFKGGEGVTKTRAFYDGVNKIMKGCLEPGCSIGYHCHEDNCEMIYILSGEARCLYDDGEERLIAGQCHYCPKGHSHSLINASATEPLTYLAVVPEQK
ncbi:MAG: cupin domain-containing protein [Bacteroidales bacterium]|nr:cupin domain-containing protein [Bacteroidales bacterium]